MKFKSDIEVQAGLKDSSGSAGTSGKILSSTGTGVAWVDNNPGISGSGTTNYISKFTGATTLGNSQLFDDGTNVGIGTSTPSNLLQVVRNQTSDTAIVVSNTGTAGATTTMSFVLQESGTPQGWFRRYRDGSGLNEIGFSTDLAFSGNVTSTKAERMRITSAGNVGIGTSSPSTKLEVQTGGSTESSIRIRQLTYNYWDLKSPAASTDFTIGDVGGEKVRITNAGNVGIGTTAPSEKLQVVSTSAGLETFPIVIQNASSAINTKAGIKFSPSGGTTRYSAIQGIQEDGNNLIGLGFITGTGATITEKMRILANGNVGIGTSTPTVRLDVSGAVNVRSAAPTITFDRNSSYTWRLVNGDGVTYPTSTFNIANNAGTSVATFLDSGNVGIGTTSPTTLLDVRGGFNVSDGTSTVRIVNSGGVGLIGTSTTHPLAIRTDNTERIRITSTGNVGIGTTSPTGRLTVLNTSVTTAALFGGGVASPAWVSIGTVNSGAVPFIQGLNNAETLNTNLSLQPSGGNVGIGTSAPSIKLQVETSVNGSDGIWARNTNTGTSAFGSINCVSGVGAINLRAYSAAHTAWPSTSMINSASAFTGGMVLFQDGANPISLWTNGSERMRVTSAGNVGIGTSAPSAKLEVSGAGIFRDKLIISADAGNEQFVIQRASDTNSQLILGYHSSGYSRIQSVQQGVGYTPLVLQEAGGNVGIGTSSPVVKLDVNGSINLTNGYNLTWGGAYGANIPTIYAVAGASSYMHFSQAGNSRGPGLAIINNGNVGIGTTSPQDKLTVKGSTNYNLNLGMLGGYSGIYVYNDASSAYNRLRIDASPLLLNTYSGSNVGIGTDSPSALLDVNGDALINGLTVGRGAGNSAYNTAFGVGALSSNTSGEYNIAIGRSANSAVNISGSTVIGTDLFTSPGNSSLTSNCLAISQHNPSNSGTQYPHIYAPDKINCPNGDTTTDVLAVDYSVYTAVFMEYSIFNSAGDEFRAGTYTVAFKGTGTPVDDDKQTVVYSGTTLSATFNVSLSLAGSIATIQLRNQDSDTYDIRVTARLLMR